MNSYLILVKYIENEERLGRKTFPLKVQQNLNPLIKHHFDILIERSFLSHATFYSARYYLLNNCRRSSTTKQVRLLIAHTYNT